MEKYIIFAIIVHLCKLIKKIAITMMYVDYL